MGLNLPIPQRLNWTRSQIIINSFLTKPNMEMELNIHLWFLFIQFLFPFNFILYPFYHYKHFLIRMVERPDCCNDALLWDTTYDMNFSGRTKQHQWQMLWIFTHCNHLIIFRYYDWRKYFLWFYTNDFCPYFGLLGMRSGCLFLVFHVWYVLIQAENLGGTFMFRFIYIRCDFSKLISQFHAL